MGKSIPYGLVRLYTASERETHVNAEFDIGQFWLEDYKFRVEYLVDQFSRMWARFNFFLTIESAAFGAFFFAQDKLKTPEQVPLYGFLLSIVWYIFGAEDRYLVSLYREQILQAAKKIKALDPSLQDYTIVGDTDVSLKDIRKRNDTMPDYNILGLWLERISAWRSSYISITRLAALLPLALAVVWVLIFTRGSLG